MADLSELIERLEMAGGPSRDLDVEIMNALAPRSPDEKRLFDGKVYPATWGAVGQVCDHIRYFVEAPFLTSSIDAAAALAERVLPGNQINVTRFTSTVARASIGNGWIEASTHKTPALALVTAILRALQQKGSSSEHSAS